MVLNQATYVLQKGHLVLKLQRWILKYAKVNEKKHWYSFDLFLLTVPESMASIIILRKYIELSYARLKKKLGKQYNIPVQYVHSGVTLI